MSLGLEGGVEDAPGPGGASCPRGSFPTHAPGPPPTFHACKRESSLLSGAERPPPPSRGQTCSVRLLGHMGSAPPPGLALTHRPAAPLTQLTSHWTPVRPSAQRESQSTTSLCLSQTQKCPPSLGPLSPDPEVPHPTLVRRRPLPCAGPPFLPDCVCWLAVSLAGTWVP